jgi:prevent-host-death family protein
MTRLSVGEFKAKFSEVLELVKKEEVVILYGRSKEPIAKIVPLKKNNQEGLLGLLEGKATFSISEGWKISSEELLEL